MLRCRKAWAGGDARPLLLDVTDAASIAAAALAIAAVDVLVNNAGISGENETPDRVDTDTFRRVYETNVFGTAAVTNAFLPALRRSAHPRIVNVSSGTGSLTWAVGAQFPHLGSYAAYRSAKTALNALTVFYAHALADDGIKVNASAPGLRRTNLNVNAAASDGDPAEAAAGSAGPAAGRRPVRQVPVLRRHRGSVVARRGVQSGPRDQMRCAEPAFVRRRGLR
ncbi:SDR family NAD(P)-dependent oxidoreductase [Nocardia sp. NPDC046473]|uniref:SDR family NAD(P)-dependent oxidoreductase n=1 Tax=Nocardia sp. NPDC046473 TaxID=3155733 RepID=UPI00340865CB